MAQGRLMPIIVAAIAVVFSIVWITTASSIGAPPFFMLFGTIMVLIVVFIFGRNLVRGVRRSPAIRTGDAADESQSPARMDSALQNL